MDFQLANVTSVSGADVTSGLDLTVTAPNSLSRYGPNEFTIEARNTTARSWAGAYSVWLLLIDNGAVVATAMDGRLVERATEIQPQESVTLQQQNIAGIWGCNGTDPVPPGSYEAFLVVYVGDGSAPSYLVGLADLGVVPFS